MQISDRGLNKAIFHTSLGWVGIAVSGQGITKIILPRTNKGAVEEELASATSPFPPFLSPEGRGGVKMLEKAVKLLRKYFSGKPVSFDLPLDLGYYTRFQRAVWKACMSIPSGETLSYGAIAKKIGRPRASRAVGQAMGANPIPVLIP